MTFTKKTFKRFKRFKQAEEIAYKHLSEAMKGIIYSIDQEADRIINQIREEIKEIFPELNPDRVDKMILMVVQRAVEMIES